MSPTKRTRRISVPTPAPKIRRHPSRSTEYDHRTGRRSKTEVDGSRRKLTKEEETALATQIMEAVDKGYLVEIDMVREIVYHIICQRNTPGLVREPVHQHVGNWMPGRDWIQSSFVKRHPHLKDCWKRAATNPGNEPNDYDNIDVWLERLGSSLAHTKLLPQNIYRVATVIGDLKRPGVVSRLSSGDSVVHSTATDERSNIATIIECTSSSGDLLTPMMILPHRNHGQYPDYLTSNLRGAASKDGHLTRDIAFDWLKSIFEVQTSSQAESRPRVLVADALGPYSSDVLNAFCAEKNIIFCKAISLEGRKVDKNLYNTGKLVEMLCRSYADIFKGTESRWRRNFASMYELARLSTSEALGLRMHVADAHGAHLQDEEPMEWDQVLQEHEDDGATPTTTLGIVKYIGKVKEGLLHEPTASKTASQIKQLVEIVEMLLKADSI